MLVKNKSFYLVFPFPIENSPFMKKKIVLIAEVDELKFEVCITQEDRLDWPFQVF